MADAVENVNEQEQQQGAAAVNDSEGRDASHDSDDEQLREAGKRALESEREARKKAAKENAELRARLEKFEDAHRTDEEKRVRELEKLRDKAAAEEKRAAELERKLTASKIAREVGLPLEMEERLRGATEDEIRADAVALREVIGGSKRGWPRVPEAGASHEAPTSTSALFGSAFSRAFNNA